MRQLIILCIELSIQIIEYKNLLNEQTTLINTIKTYNNSITTQNKNYIHNYVVTIICVLYMIGDFYFLKK
jgi:hypothetical protein